MDGWVGGSVICRSVGGEVGRWLCTVYGVRSSVYSVQCTVYSVRIVRDMRRWRGGGGGVGWDAWCRVECGCVGFDTFLGSLSLFLWLGGEGVYCTVL